MAHEAILGTNPLQGDNTTSIEFAVSRLLKEPEQSAPLVEEPEDTAEPLEGEELEGEEQEELAPDEEEGEYEDEESSEEEEALEYYAIKVDGEEIEVSLDELQSGYQRQKDYTKKTQALAEQRKEYEAKAAKLEQLQTQYLQQAQLANELLNRDLKKFEVVDWESLKLTDPVGYVQKQIELNDVRQRQQQLQQQAQQAYEYNQQVQAQEMSQYLELQRKEAMQRFPDWRDSEKAEAHKAALFNYGKTVGYTDEQMGGVNNALDLVVLDKAMKYDEMVKAKQGITKKTTTPAVRKRVKVKGVAPKGSLQAKAKAQIYTEKSAALRKSGSLKDAASLMWEMRNSREIIKPK
jgi:hypothetical protein